MFGSFQASHSLSGRQLTAGPVGPRAAVAFCRGEREVAQVRRVLRRHVGGTSAVRPARSPEDREEHMHAVLGAVAHGAVVEAPVVGRISRVGRMRRSPRCDTVGATPVQVQAHLLHVQLLERGEGRIDRPEQRLRLVVDPDTHVARRRCRLRLSSQKRRRKDGDQSCESHAQTPTGFAPSDSTQRRRPSSRSTSGSQPRICRARVMSGRRTCGSSVGSASNTTSLVEPVTRMTA